VTHKEAQDIRIGLGLETCINSVQKSNGNSIEFSLSNTEQRNNWLNSSHWTLDTNRTPSSSLLILKSSLDPNLGLRS